MHICKEFTFDAAHTIPGLPEHHKCSRLHGHTYKVVLFVEGLLDEIGMIADYAEIAKIWQPLHDQLDHRYLNDIAGLEKPTTEVLAWWICQRVGDASLNVRRQASGNFEGTIAARVTRVRVYESATTYCEVP